jgi:phenylpropionate dioxygenase-like ring-hydroxylating dioxygenase large terminal subunit
MDSATGLRDDPIVVGRILEHIDRRTTDLAAAVWREPLENYRSAVRYEAEVERVIRRLPVAFCPSAALPEPGSYVARETGGTPVVAVRGRDGVVRAFLNACSHRGAQVAQSSGCAKALTCPYHGWTYGLEGDLRGVPHPEGFPGLDKSARGLAPFAAVERGGVVFVAQGPPEGGAELADLPPLVPERFRLVGKNEIDVAANWKIAVEGFLEGYHIRATHPETFYPVQYDNVNVVESFGRHNRVAFPYRNVERQREVAPAERSAEGRITYVYHLFPNTIVATFPGRRVVVTLEPTGAASTRFVTWTLSDHHDGTRQADEALRGEQTFVDKGAAEDRAVVASIQRSLARNPREFFEFGLFEGAIGHFHRELAAALEGAAR